MRTFLARHQYLVVWICGLVIVGAIATLIIQLNGTTVPTASVLSQPAAPGVPAASSTPNITLAIQANGKGRTLVVQWNDLPAGTTALDIFRGAPARATSTWKLWKTVSVASGMLNSGSASFALASGDLGYEYYLAAVGSDGSGGGTGSGGANANVLWTSSVSTPSTSAAAIPEGNGGQSGSSNSPSQNTGNSVSAPTSSQNNAQSSSTASSTGSATNTGSGSMPSGDPYYDPQVQIEGYGTARGSFWVEHVNQSIEVGWQDLPAYTDDIIFYRSTSQTGPWSQFLEQQNPGSTGSFSLGIVDSTMNEPYYYQMVAAQGSAASATYGPVYLPPATQ